MGKEAQIIMIFQKKAVTLCDLYIHLGYYGYLLSPAA